MRFRMFRGLGLRLLWGLGCFSGLGPRVFRGLGFWGLRVWEPRL